MLNFQSLLLVKLFLVVGLENEHTVQSRTGWQSRLLLLSETQVFVAGIVFDDYFAAETDAFLFSKLCTVLTLEKVNQHIGPVFVDLVTECNSTFVCL